MLRCFQSTQKLVSLFDIFMIRNNSLSEYKFSTQHAPIAEPTSSGLLALEEYSLSVEEDKMVTLTGKSKAQLH